MPPEDLTRDPQLAAAGRGNDLNYWQTRYIGSVTGLDGRGLWITPETTFEGLVPDGNATVTLVLGDGTREAEPVTENVYEATVHGRVVAIVNRDIYGRVVRTTVQ